MAIILTKGQKISLDKEAGKSLDRVAMGLGWDASAKKSGFLGGLFGGGGEIDLDASCVLFDEAGKIVDAVWFQQLRSKDGSIQHTGDNVTGQGEGDDEKLIVELKKVPPHVRSLVFTVNSFSGQSFDSVQNAFCRLVDLSNNQEVARYQLNNCQGSHTALIMSKLYRHEGVWKMHAIGENAKGRTFHDLLPIITPNL